MEDVELDENGLNANIKTHILPDDKMREIGFTDADYSAWYFCKYWGDIDVSFNVRIEKDKPNSLRIDVLDEAFLQPYDYQYLLRRDPNFKVAKLVKSRVDKCMTYLIDNGILSGWQVGDYL